MKRINPKFLFVLAGALTMAAVAIFPARALDSAFSEDTSAPSNADTFDWGSLGGTFTSVSTPVSVTSEGGQHAVVLNDGGTLERRDQGNGWDGSFAPGATLLWNDEDGNNITINFSTPVSAAGAQIEADPYGAYTGQISIYGSTNNLLATFTEDGATTSAGDNSAIYLGTHNTSGTADIYSVSFSVPSDNGTFNDFAIGNVSIAVPEPTSSYAAWVAVLACCAVILHRKFRKNLVRSGIVSGR